MRTAKARRHSGYVNPHCTIRLPKEDLITNCLEPQPYYSDWDDHRDGFRDWSRDGKKIKKTLHKVWNPKKRKKLNDKQKLLLKRRKAKKEVVKCRGKIY